MEMGISSISSYGVLLRLSKPFSFEMAFDYHLFFISIKSGERMMDYMNLDDRSIGMFWVVSYTMAQPACETVMHWLTSAGVTELLPGPTLQSNERLVVMREVSPLPISLLSGFSTNLCLKLAYQMEESMFSGQVLTMVSSCWSFPKVKRIKNFFLKRISRSLINSSTCLLYV